MRTPLANGTLLSIGGSEYYEIKALAGEGGGSLIYEADRLHRTAEGLQRDGLHFALKECFPLSSEHLFTRTNTGEIVPERDSERSRAYLHAVQQMQLRESEVTAEIYGTGFRLVPVLSRATEVELSVDVGATFVAVQNTVTVMESLSAKGSTLRAILNEKRRLPLPQALRIVEQLLYAVKEVHQAGYLHLDLQDGNVFLKGSLSDESNFVTLLDFGSARKRLEDGKCAVIADRTLFSTEGFSAPEIRTHNDGTLRLGPEADVYSIGYLLLLLLTGRRYSCHELAARKNGCYLTGIALHRIRCPRHLVDRLQGILARMLAQDPVERCHEVDGLLREVSDFFRALQPYRSDLASVEYDAFLCYRHSPLDSFAAKKMQQLLEHFPVPRAAAGSGGKHRIKRIFLDEGELSSCADFGLQIREALKNAGWLIVVCSPEAAKSPWISLEIDTFLEYHDRSRILAVLIEGEPEEAFPKQLCGAFPGDVGEVLAADARGTGRRAVLNRLKQDAVYRIAAPILGTTYDTLKQRRRRYVLQRAAAVTAACLFAAAGITACVCYQQQQIYIERQTMLISESRYLAQQSETLLKSGARAEAIEAALKALPEGEEDDTRPLVPEAVYALTEAVYAYQQETAERFAAEGQLPANRNYAPYVYEINRNGTGLVMADSNGQLCGYDLEQFTLLYTCFPSDLDGETEEEAFVSVCSLSSGAIIAFSPSKAYCWDPVQNQVLWSTAYGEEQGFGTEEPRMYAGETVTLCEEQGYVAFCAGNDLLISDLNTGVIRQRIRLTQEEGYWMAEFLLEMKRSQDGTRVALVLQDLETTDNNGQLYFVDLVEESVVVCDTVRSAVLASEFIGNDSVAVALTDCVYNDTENQEIAIELKQLRFQDGAELWARTCAAAYDAGAVTAQLCSTPEPQHDDFPVLTAALGHEVLQLDGETGETIGSAGYEANVLTVAVEDANNVFAALSDGSIWKTDMAQEESASLGAVDGAFCDAVVCRNREMLLMFGENSSDFTVLSRRMGDRNFTALNLENVLDVSYCQSEQNRYRITVSEQGEGEHGFGQTLCIWAAQTTDLLACTDSEGSKEPVGLMENGSGEDLYFYLQRIGLEQKLIGLKIPTGRQVFESVFPADEAEYVSVECIGMAGSRMYFSCKNTITAIDGLTGETLEYLCPDFDSVYAIVSNSGRWIAMIGESFGEADDSWEQSICLLNLDSGEYTMINDLKLSEWLALENSLAFSPDECWLAVPANGKLSIVNTETGRIEQTTDISCELSAVSTFLSDHILAACADSGRLVLWDLSRKSVVQEDDVQYAYVEAITRETDAIFQVTVSDDYGDLCSYLYTFEEDGGFSRYQKIPQDAVSVACGEVFCFGENQEIGFYPLYSLDGLIAKANDMLRDGPF